MEQFIETNSGRPVNIGDYVSLHFEKKTLFGVIKGVEKYIVTHSTIPLLLQRGFIKKAGTGTISTDVSYYVQKLAIKMDLALPAMCEWLEEMNNNYPQVVLQLLLKQVADELIEKSGKRITQHNGYYYYISMMDGKVSRLERLPDNITFADYVSLFKREEEANLAKQILKDQFKFMYGRE